MCFKLKGPPNPLKYAVNHQIYISKSTEPKEPQAPQRLNRTKRYKFAYRIVLEDQLMWSAQNDDGEHNGLFDSIG